jgi:hydrogenase maturation protein HypF
VVRRGVGALALAAPRTCEPYAFALAPGAGGDEADLRPTVRAIAAELRGGVPVEAISGRFHETLAHVVVAACRRGREASGVSLVALTGGCFQNRRLLERCAALLGGAGFEVLVHRAVPPNDGGVALGQAAVAAHRLAREEGR